MYGLVSQWPQVHAALGQLDGWDVASAAVSAIAGLGCMMLAWRALLADLGSPLPLPAAIRVMFVGQLGKYVPGAVWAVAAQVELARDYAVRAQAQRHREPGQHGGHAGGGAGGRGRDAAAGLGARGQAVLVGAGA